MERLESTRSKAFISVASIWEAEIKSAANKPGAINNLPDFAEALGLIILPIDATDAVRAARLPPHHKDPFDRMVIAQALNRDLTIVTHDRVFARYDVPVLWT